MGYTSNGLPNGGHTAHYAISYDETLSPADGLTRALGLFAACEQDFALIQRWFTGVSMIYSFPIPVQITTTANGGEWHPVAGIITDFSNWSPTITIGPGSGTPVSTLRYLLVAEMSEMFMNSQDTGWFQGASFFDAGDEGSKGEGLSRFLGGQMLLLDNPQAVPPPGYALAAGWLNSARQDFVNHAPDDYQPDPTNGCTTLFLYYLHTQLGYGIQQIIANGSSTLAGVYKNLTGSPDGWTPFITLVDTYYPQGYTYNPAGDNIFPVSNLASFGSPNQITCGYGDATLVAIDSPAMAEVNITLSSDDPSLVSVPALVTVPVGATSASVSISTTAIQGPFDPKFINVHATYAGKTVSMTVEVVPPRVASVTLQPDIVTCGDPSTGTVTLSRPSLNGAVMVDLSSGAPGFATVQAQVPVPQNAQTATFPIATRNIEIPFPTARATIQASYAGSAAYAVLLVRSRIVMGILQSLTLSPTTVVQGNTSRGTVTLVAAVPMDTHVSVGVYEGGGPVPHPGTGPAIASVQSPVTIPAGRLSNTFTITTRHELAPGTSRQVTIVAGAVVTKYAALTVTS